MQHANRAVDEVRRAEFFRKGGSLRGLVKGKRWLLLTRWVNLTAGKRRQLNELFALNRQLLKAYLLKESLDRLWDYRYAGAMTRYFKGWMDQLRWQRLKPFQKLADMLLEHFDGILNYCRHESPAGSRRSDQREYQNPAEPGPRVQEPTISPAEGPADGCHQNRIRGLREGRMNNRARRFLAQSRKSWGGRRIGELHGGYLCR